MSIGHAPHRIKSFRRFDRVSPVPGVGADRVTQYGPLADGCGDRGTAARPVTADPTDGTPADPTGPLSRNVLAVMLSFSVRPSTWTAYQWRANATYERCRKIIRDMIAAESAWDPKRLAKGVAWAFDLDERDRWIVADYFPATEPPVAEGEFPCGRGCRVEPSFARARAEGHPLLVALDGYNLDISDLAGPRVIVPAPEPPVPVRHEPADPIPAAFAPPVCRCLNPCSVGLRGVAGTRYEGIRAVVDLRRKGWECCSDCRAYNQGRWATWLRRILSWSASPGRAAAAGVPRPPDVPDQPQELYVAAVEPSDWPTVKKRVDRCDGLYATIVTAMGCVDVPSLLLDRA